MVLLVLLVHKHTGKTKRKGGRRKPYGSYHLHLSCQMKRMALVRQEPKVLVGLTSAVQQQHSPTLSSQEAARQHVKFPEHQCDSVFHFENTDGYTAQKLNC